MDFIFRFRKVEKVFGDSNCHWRLLQYCRI